MKKAFGFVLFLLCLNFLFAQKVEFQTLLKDNISIRALQIYDGKVWYSGTDSKFGYVSLKDSADKKQIRLSGENLQFRTLAQNNAYFYAINIESPAYFFRIDKLTLKPEVVHTDSAKNAFYDALYFQGNYFYTFSDPEENLKLKFARFTGNGNFNINYLNKELLDLKKGEAAFAASNTNIASSKKNIWIATGGMVSRIIKMNLKTGKIHLFETPFIQGTSSQGIYSIDFYDENFGIAVGGDYTKQAENINNIATTNDGGKTWQIQASGKNGGYKTCVKFRPKSKGKDMIAVGDQNIEFSNDYGKTWKTISEEKGLYVCEWIDENTAVFAGKNRIVKMKFSNGL
ncbi:glycosyl hydrolase [Chryseobacterium gotjawalense]|uniref:Glycosyl hydrolase n=1 Tax=Chryseobacterium gotjawalense TaxID=3042315 RepID=A0ABY8RI64_9FLAO|nr:glycosyl hydrolase [Chryseobacterium sp. wdc7]WHF52867.1 glycosyl hydrolase [Chryseobacterium sp. wdc7]